MSVFLLDFSQTAPIVSSIFRRAKVNWSTWPGQENSVLFHVCLRIDLYLTKTNEGSELDREARPWSLRRSS